MTDDMTKRRDEMADKRSKSQCTTGNQDLDKAIAWYLKIGFEDGFDAGVAEMQAQVEFLKMYYNPADTSFKTMIETFSQLSDEQKQALINLTEALLKTKEAK